MNKWVDSGLNWIQHHPVRVLTALIVMAAGVPIAILLGL